MEIPVQLIAASTQVKIGYVIAAIVLLAMAAYWLFNWIEGARETGAEIELAANRKPGMSDEVMESSRLDLALTGGLGMLTVIALALPVYWLGEPNRHQGLIDWTDEQYVVQGEELYEANCAQCHGSANGDGGFAADFSIVDGGGVFVEQVQWKAPSLAAVLDRFSYNEVKYILNYGRSNSPMPAWGAPGGGPMTEQQLDKVIAYLAHEQQSTEDIRKGVLDGLPGAAAAKAEADNPGIHAEVLALEHQIHDLEDELGRADDGDKESIETLIAEAETEHKELQGQLDDAAEKILDDAATDQVVLGELLFNNPAASGAYGCARCHSAGWSISANDYPENPLVAPIVNGGGGLGPALNGVADQFETPTEQVDFITKGAQNGVKYGAYGQGDGGGGMPGFGVCSGDQSALGTVARIEENRIDGHCDEREGILTLAQIEAIVAYERSLG